MLATEAVKDWIKERLPEGTGISVGRIDGNADKYVGVYDKPVRGPQHVCIGGPPMTRYQEKRVSILIHWTKNPVDAEAAAGALWQQMYAKTGIFMGETRIISIDPGATPIGVGFDQKGIAEYVIEATILYERNET